MQTKNNIKKIVIALCSLLVIGAIVAGVIFIPDKAVADAKQYSYVADEQSFVDFGSAFSESIAVKGATLFVDKATSAVVMKSGNKTVFNSFSVASAEQKLASVINVTLRDGNGNAYIMNSTDNSVKYGTFDVFVDKNEAKFDFALFGSEKSSQKGEAGAVWAKIPVVFKAGDGAIEVSVDMAAVACADDICVEKISILPGLFSVDIPTTGMAYTVPDGCGAQILLDAVSEEDFSQTLPVYGSDVAFFEYSQGANLPCFAFSDGRALNCAVINEGDGISELTVVRSKTGGGKLYNTFRITSFAKIEGTLERGESYQGVVSQRYYVSNEKSADYNELASFTRDTLISKGYISAEFTDKFNDLPFMITVVGSKDNKNDSVYSTFENASEIVALLKSRGVRSVALRFVGGGSKGLATNSLTHKLNTSLGGEDGYNELCDVAAQNNSSAWLDVNLTTINSSDGVQGTDIYGSIRNYLGITPVKSKIISTDAVNTNISSVYKLMSEFESGNVCINDASFLLYTDIYSGVNRQNVLENLRNKTESLSLGGGFMLASPAVYLMKNADAVVTMPQKASCEGVAGVTSVPLLQMVLHGSVCYGTDDVNVKVDATDAILKAVEYGASPSFVFTHNNGGVIDYGPYAAQTAKYYSFVKRMMPLMDMEITHHERVVSGVYKITYDYSKVVYVNYNPSVVEVNGILISAKDFVII